MREAVIVSTARTGLAKSWKGALNMTHGATMGGVVVKAAVERAGIDPAEVEDVLMKHAAVALCAVVGRPDDRWGETVHAEIVLRNEASAEELISHCRERIAGYKCPRSIGFREAMPLSAAGKILKLDRPLTYARVDLIRDDSGAPCLLELELTEPSVFFAHGPADRADAFASQLSARLALGRTDSHGRPPTGKI